MDSGNLIVELRSCKLNLKLTGILEIYVLRGTNLMINKNNVFFDSRRAMRLKLMTK